MAKMSEAIVDRELIELEKSGLVRLYRKNGKITKVGRTKLGQNVYDHMQRISKALVSPKPRRSK
jgi:hypothetical protein